MKVKQPTVKQYYILKYSENIMAVIETVKELSGDSITNVSDFQQFVTGYLAAIELEKSKNPDYNIPYFPEDETEKQYFNCNTQDIKIVSDYTGLSFFEIENLNVFVFWAYLHDAAVWNFNKTESGREYLEKAYTHQQKEPDREALRKQFGGGKHGK